MQVLTKKRKSGSRACTPNQEPNYYLDEQDFEIDSNEENSIYQNQYYDDLSSTEERRRSSIMNIPSAHQEYQIQMNILEDNRSDKSLNSSNNGILMTQTPSAKKSDTKIVEEPLKDEN